MCTRQSANPLPRHSLKRLSQPRQSVSPAAHWTRKSLVALLTLSAGCAPQTYRYANHILIPPNVKQANLKQRTLTLPIEAKCAVSEAGIHFTPAHAIRLTVQPNQLTAHPAGWLQQWGEQLEEDGCLTAGTGQELATRITQIVPLDPAAASNLLRSPLLAYRDLTPDYRLFSAGPILRSDAKPGATAIISTEATGASLTITAKASADLIGVETAWYAIRMNHHSAGSRISFVSAEDRIGDQVSHPDKPRLNYLHFSDNAAYYRFFLHTADSASDHLAIVLAAPTQEELRQQTRRLESDPGVCTTAVGLCVEAPFGYALSPALVATVNGTEVGIRDRWTVRGALQAAGISHPETVVPTLKVERFYDGQLVPVKFNPTRTDILDLPLSGREQIATRP